MVLDWTPKKTLVSLNAFLNGQVLLVDGYYWCPWLPTYCSMLRHASYVHLLQTHRHCELAGDSPLIPRQRGVGAAEWKPEPAGKWNYQTPRFTFSCPFASFRALHLHQALKYAQMRQAPRHTLSMGSMHSIRRQPPHAHCSPTGWPYIYFDDGLTDPNWGCLSGFFWIRTSPYVS